MTIVPKPIGFETTNLFNNKTVTLNEFFRVKKKIYKIIKNATKEVNSNSINNYNLLNYVILHEYDRYNDIIQPDNLYDFYEYILALFEDTKKTVLSENKFSKLDRCKHGEINKCYGDTNLSPMKQCCICIENFNNNDDIIVLDCKHNFHTNCIKEWLINQSNTCPFCKKDI